MMYTFIIFFGALFLYIFLYRVFIPMTANCTYIKPLCPKFTAPKLLLNFRMKSENLFGCDTLYCLDYSSGTIHRNTLNQKMNMIFICTNLYKDYFKSLRKFKADFFQTTVNCFCENYSTVFGRTNKMIK